MGWMGKRDRCTDKDAEARAERAEADLAKAREEVERLRGFVSSFAFSVNQGSFYKDAYLNLISPDSVTIRLANKSDGSAWIAKLEDARRAALEPKP